MMMSRLDTSSSDEINERRRQMSACRRKYAALGMAGRPQVFSATPKPRYGSRRTALKVALLLGVALRSRQGALGGAQYWSVSGTPGLVACPPHLGRRA